MKTIKKYYKNGQIEERYTVNKDGKLHGLWKKWHDNGQLWGKSNWKDGKLHGLYEVWKYDDTLRKKAYYIENKEVSQYEWEEYNQTQINEIINKVCKNYRLTLKDIQKKNRTRNVADCRHSVCFLLLENTDLTPLEIGYIIRRDRTSVIHSYNVAKNLIETDQSFKSKINCKGIKKKKSATEILRVLSQVSGVTEKKLKSVSQKGEIALVRGVYFYGSR